jgi:hypothetical protein
MSDLFTLYETSMQFLLDKLGQEHPRYSEALTYQQHLRENIAMSRQYGDTEMRRAERNAIIVQINNLAQEETGWPVIGLMVRGSPSGIQRFFFHDYGDPTILNLSPALPAPKGKAFEWSEKVEAFEWSEKVEAFEWFESDMRNLAESVAEPVTKTINAWIGERHEQPLATLVVGQRYRLSFNVGPPVDHNLVDAADAHIPETDIPPDGLPTTWLISSRTVMLEPTSDAVRVNSPHAGKSRSWRAQFSLHIPREGESATVSLQITPQSAVDAGLDVIIMAHNELYRDFWVDLTVEDDSTTRVPPPSGTTPATNSTLPMAIKDDTTRSRANQLGLRSPHMWQRPPGTLRIFVTRHGDATITGDIVANGKTVQVTTESLWHGAQAAVAGPINHLRGAAERFRSMFEDYLNTIDPDDLLNRLQAFTPVSTWIAPANAASLQHQRTWEAVQQSKELRELAVRGKILYDKLFPEDSELRSWLDTLEPGHRIDLKWTETAPGWVPGLPWGLLYVHNPDDPINPVGFWGLRFRIHYTAYDARLVPKNLGHPDQTYRGHWMYWGGKKQDATLVEARWQRGIWANVPASVFAPGDPPGPDPRQELRSLLSTTKPMPVLYLFCQCAVDPGTGEPVLRFGSTNQGKDILRIVDIPQSRLTTRPLVFANACTTTANDPYIANALEAFFFNKGCSAFLGTETKVPIQFASRFATVFFHFFYRQADPIHAPIAAGEAMAQTRLFLWRHYCNIGGILYSYINKYELFMADEAEIEQWRS